MGQLIVVTEKPSSNPGIVRFETNRALTGMDHERYLRGQEIWGNRPPDELARRLLAHGTVEGVQVNGNMVTVDLSKGRNSDGLREIIENLYRFYPDQPEAATAEPAVEPAVEPAAADAEPAAEPGAEAAVELTESTETTETAPEPAAE